MGNMQFWNAMAKPPVTALKKITGGRLNGFTDISPQWRAMALTEQFGPCGVGWKFVIDKTWTEPATDGQVFAFAQVSLFVKVDGQWSDPIPGIGGNFLIEKERAGLHSSDEGLKMAVTDAIGTAAKMLGVAADIYLGNWDGSKYREQPKNSYDKTKPSSAWSGGKPPAEKQSKPPEKPPEKPNPPAIPWSKMTQQQMEETVLAAVKQCKTGMKLEDAAAKLKEIASKSNKLNQLESDRRERVFAAIADAQYSVEAELNALNQ